MMRSHRTIPRSIRSKACASVRPRAAIPSFTVNMELRIVPSESPRDRRWPVDLPSSKLIPGRSASSNRTRAAPASSSPCRLRPRHAAGPGACFRNRHFVRNTRSIIRRNSTRIVLFPPPVSADKKQGYDDSEEGTELDGAAWHKGAACITLALNTIRQQQRATARRRGGDAICRAGHARLARSALRPCGRCL